MHPRPWISVRWPSYSSQRRLRNLVPWLLLLTSGCSRAQAIDTTNEYLTFVRSRAAELRSTDAPPITRSDWNRQADRLRHRLQEAWGSLPPSKAPLQPRILGVIQKEGYRIERLTFQTLPGVWMTANAYVPDRPGPLPALLAVHGHWAGAKQDPVVQARCIGPARLGYFVLAVDAFGAGERGIGKALGEYHGEMTAATLLPSGLNLAGLQLYENQRAADYLQSRREVDRNRIAITGASGGGNQTMYAGAWDQRFAAVVPVCSVGNYQAYLGAACCLCEVIPGALQFTEEWGILGLTSPRALLVMSATRDARQFSVGEAAKSIAAATPIFHLHGQPSHLAHAVFDSGHDYSQPMRERLYGWLARHLRNAPASDPLSEAPFHTEPPESLRCFPGDSRPDDWITLPRYAAEQGKHALQSKRWPKTLPDWINQRPTLRRQLQTALALPSGPSRTGETAVEARPNDSALELSFSPEPGIHLKAIYHPGGGSGRTVIVLDLEGQVRAAANPLTQRLQEEGWNVTTLDLRATGTLGWPGDKIGRAPDHNTAEWGLWIGRPLLGQWAVDVMSLIDALGHVEPRVPRDVRLVGFGPAGLVAYAVAALDDRVGAVLTEGTLATYLSDRPYEQQRLGTIVPGILPRLGDIPSLISLIAPRPVWVDSPVGGTGRTLTEADRNSLLSASASVWKLSGQDRQFKTEAAVSDQDRAAFLRQALR